MPELPEVETTLRGLAPHLQGQVINNIVVSQPKLRWPVPTQLSHVTDCRVLSLWRRAKYLLIETDQGHLILHLGMSGSLRIVEKHSDKRKHDHVEFQLSSGKVLRYHDPRRFGAVLWTTHAPEDHPLLIKLGPEPLDSSFDGTHLFRASRKRKVAIKNLIMDSHIVVGVGNIYASEALFLASVRPGKSAGRITAQCYDRIAESIKQVLSDAITMGGTTLRDFVNSDGQPGYFQQTLNVYGRKGESCRNCSQTIKMVTLGQRSTFYCPECQS